MAFISLNAAASEPAWKKIYFRADGGVGFPQKINNKGIQYNFKNTPVYGAGLGFKINDMFRTDINFQHTELKAPNSNNIFNKTGSDAIFLNGYFNLTDFEPMTPYFTAGVGYAMNNTKNSRKVQGSVVTTAEGVKTKSFAWNVGAGVKSQIYKQVDFDFAYRFINIGDIKMKNVIEDGDQLPSIHLKKNNAHQLTVGIIFNM